MTNIKDKFKTPKEKEPRVTNHEIRLILEDLKSRLSQDLPDIFIELDTENKPGERNEKKMKQFLIDKYKVDKWDATILVYYYLHQDEIPPLQPEEEKLN